MLKTVEDVIAALRDRRCQEYLHVNLELKEDWAQKHGDKLSALANKLDQITSFLVIGVKDTGALAGKGEAWAKHTEEVLSQHINQNLDPLQASKTITCRELEASWILIVTIQNAGEVTYWADYAYCAAGTTTARMEPDEILKLRIQLPGLIDYSNQHHRSSYNEELVRRFASEVQRRAHPNEKQSIEKTGASEVLRGLGLYERQAARLLFGKAPYRVIRYDSADEPISNERREGLFGILLPKFVHELSVSGNGHFPGRALKEALSNAVAHAAYFESDGDIILEIHHDSIVMSNLCLKESSYFANRWFSRSHKTVNGLLMESLRIGGFVDELGRGKNLIFSESIRNGKQPPEVHIENAGKYQRWKLLIYGGREEQKLLRLLERCREVYQDEKRSLIALALVLWRDRPVAEIRNYVDGDFSRQFVEVLSSSKGPIFYYQEKDRIVLRRWAEVLLGEGKDSKALSAAEEERLQSTAFEICTKYEGGQITPNSLRELAAMGNTKSEQTLSSTILSRWCKNGIVKKSGKGKYLFEKKSPQADPFDELMKMFETGNREKV